MKTMTMDYLRKETELNQFIGFAYNGVCYNMSGCPKDESWTFSKILGGGLIEVLADFDSFEDIFTTKLVFGKSLNEILDEVEDTIWF